MKVKQVICGLSYMANHFRIPKLHQYSDKVQTQIYYNSEIMDVAKFCSDPLPNKILHTLILQLGLHYDLQ